jgi:hypothetical protein
MLIVRPDGSQEHVRDFTQTQYTSDVAMCQEFLRRLNTLAQECNGITLAIAHGGSASPKGDPHCLPFIAARSFYTLTVDKRNYRDKYHSTEGRLWTGFREFPSLYFLDLVPEVGQYLFARRLQLRSLELEDVAREFGLGHLQDCAAIAAIDERVGISSLKLALAETC